MPQKLRRLYVYRLRAGLTQEGLAEAMGVPQETISMWENGLNIPLSHLERLKEIFIDAGVMSDKTSATTLEAYYDSSEE